MKTRNDTAFGNKSKTIVLEKTKEPQEVNGGKESDKRSDIDIMKDIHMQEKIRQR